MVVPSCPGRVGLSDYQHVRDQLELSQSLAALDQIKSTRNIKSQSSVSGSTFKTTSLERVHLNLHSVPLYSIQPIQYLNVPL